MKFLKLSLCLLLAVILLPIGCTSGDSGNSAVISSNRISLSRGEFVYFFARTVDNTLSSDNAPNTFKPLKEQIYEGNTTWFDVMLSTSLEYVKQVVLLCEAARDAGVELTAEDGADAAIRSFREECERKYGVSFEAYLDVSFHGYTSESDYSGAVKLEMLARKYLSILREEIQSGISDEKISEYKMQNGIEDDGTLTKNLMLIYLGTNGAQRAEEIMSSLNTLTLSAENFARIATQRSDSKEYLYENCAEGDMNALIDSWLYASDRKVGDVGTVKDGDAAFVLYYYGNGRTVADWEAVLAMVESDYRAALAALAEKFPITVNKDILRSLDI